MEYKTARVLGTVLTATSYASLLGVTVSAVGAPPVAVGLGVLALASASLERRFVHSARFRSPAAYPEGALPPDIDIRPLTGPLSRDFFGRKSLKIDGAVEKILVDTPDLKQEWIPTMGLGSSPAAARNSAIAATVPEPRKLLVPVVGKDPDGLLSDPTLADWVGYDGNTVSRTWDPTGLSLIVPLAGAWRDGSPSEYKLVDQWSKPLRADETEYVANGKDVYYESLFITGDGAKLRLGSMVGKLPIKVKWRNL